MRLGRPLAAASVMAAAIGASLAASPALAGDSLAFKFAEDQQVIVNPSDTAFSVSGTGCTGKDAAVGIALHTSKGEMSTIVKATPDDTVVLTLACGKYRFNDLDLGEIGGLPRLMDMGQCNDAYSAIQVAVALARAFDCGVNDLPLSMVLSWYEQKAVCILLTLLYLGIRNIKLGPTLPAFVSPGVLDVLVENYGIGPITTPEADLAELLGE